MGKHVPILAIVGRPNVGKSALFNRLCKQRLSIVDGSEGVTRDRLYARSDLFGRPFEVIDTGGIDPVGTIPFNKQIRRQAEVAIEEADALVFVVDGQVGLTHLDAEVAHILRASGKATTLVVNKIDTLDQMDRIYPFYTLGFKRLMGVSASHGLHIAELLEMALSDGQWEGETHEIDGAIQVAIVGRPNVGKSTLINHLLNEKRCLVSPIAGTTRDSVDVDMTIDGRLYRLVDTAGIRNKTAEHQAVDKFAAIRTGRAIERADLCVLMLDAASGMTTQEKRIAKMIEEKGKGCILLMNKWDLVQGYRMEHCLRVIRDEIPFLAHCPVHFVSAEQGRNLDQLYAEIEAIYAQSRKRVTTGALNRFVEQAMQRNHPPMVGGKRLRIYYLAQVGVAPPTFVLFVNRANLMEGGYKKYLINQFRSAFAFTGNPVRFSLRGKQGSLMKMGG